MNTQSQAFEYVLGTLRGEEREQFETALASDDTLRREVAFWEEQMITMDDTQKSLTPREDTWRAIEKQLGPTSRQGSPEQEYSPEKITSPERKNHQEPEKNFIRNTLDNWRWLFPSVVMSTLLLVVIFTAPISTTTNKPNTDYVAVLTAPDGEATLTALTTGSTQTMWLQWETEKLPVDSSAQLWVISKRDGQARAIGLFNNTQTDRLKLSDAYWRLVKDAEYLLLTQEEPGGSPIDEPSDVILAKGICIRFKTTPPS